MVYAAAADYGDDDVSVLVEKCMKCWWMLEGLLEAIMWESVFVSPPKKHFRSERVKKDAWSNTDCPSSSSSGNLPPFFWPACCEKVLQEGGKVFLATVCFTIFSPGDVGQN